MFLSIAKFVMQGRLNYFLAVFLLASLPLPFFWWMAAGFIVLVTLRKGAFEGSLALLAAILPTGIMVGMGGQVDMAAGIAYSSQISLPNVAMLQRLVFFNDTLSLVLVFLSSLMLRETVRLDWTLVAASVSICLLIAIGVLPLDDWRALFELNFDQLVLGLPEAYQSELSLLQGNQKQEMLRYISGHYLSLTMLMQVYFPLLLGRWLQSKLYNPEGFTKEFVELSFSRLTATVLLVAGLLIDRLLPGTVGISWVLTAPLIVVGAAIVHLAVQRKLSGGRGWLIGFYLMLPLTFNFVAVLGWLDALWDVRSKLNSRMS